MEKKGAEVVFFEKCGLRHEMAVEALEKVYNTAGTGGEGFVHFTYLRKAENLM